MAELQENRRTSTSDRREGTVDRRSGKRVVSELKTRRLTDCRRVADKSTSEA